MQAGACFGAVVLADAVARRREGLAHLWCFTDSIATSSAITSGSSGAPQLNFLVTWLSQRQPSVQFISVHVPGVRNVVADRLSRRDAPRVLEEVAAAGTSSERLRPAPDVESMLLHVSSLEHRRNA